MHSCDSGVGESAGGLARFDRRVDPALGKERLCKLGHFRRKIRIGGHDGFLRLGPWHAAVVFHGEGRVAVPCLHRFKAEPFGLERVVAMRQARVGGHDGVAQRLDHFGLNVVGQVPPGLRGGHLAPAVFDLFFLGERVVDAREELDVVLEHGGECVGGGFAFAPVLIGEQVQRGLKVQHLAVHVKFQPGHGFIKQAVPCGRANGGLIMQEFLKLIGELIGLHCAQAVKDRFIAREILIGGKKAAEVGIVDAVDLQRVEHKRRGKGGDFVLRVGHEFGAVTVGGDLVIAQPGIGHDPPGDDVNLLVALHGVQKACCIQRVQLPFVIAREIGAGRFKPCHVARQFGAVGAWVEVCQIPFWQIAERVMAAG